MIVDSQTNKLYLADCLPLKHPKFYKELELLLNSNSILFELLPNTKDIWAVDYMPIQITIDKFIQFAYNPDYLQSKKWSKTISNVDAICNSINLNAIKSNIILDGGNIIKTHNKILMCDKVFNENQSYNRKELIQQLKYLFEVDDLYFVPQQPKDFTGHADGMVRFLNEKTVLINDYTKENIDFYRAFLIALDNARLNYVTIPYNPYENIKDSQANGCYINFLQMEKHIIIPTFGLKEDEEVIMQFEKLFTEHTILTINSNEIADNGGVLNCITWNIEVEK